VKRASAKRWMIAGLLTASLAVWIPQISGMVSEEPVSEEPVVPAMDGAMLDPSAAPAPTNDIAPIDPARSRPTTDATASSEPMPMPGGTAEAGAVLPEGPVAPPADTRSISELMTSLRSDLRAIQTERAQAGETNLEELARAWSRKHGAAQQSTGETQPTGTSDSRSKTLVESLTASSAESTPTRDEAEANAWLDAHPLRMILIGGDRKVARLGTVVAGEGDALAHGLLVLRRIDDDGVVLECGGKELRVMLTAFETRAGTSKTTSAPTQKSAPSAAPAASSKPTAPASADSSAPVPTPKGS
jgi:hypothetical protein